MVFAEQKDKEIHKVSYELLGKARELADQINEEVYCCICGSREIDTNELIYRGADKVFHVQDEEIFDVPEVMTYVENLVKIIEDRKSVFLEQRVLAGR